MIVCPHCGRDLPDDSVFCTYCGKPIEKVKKVKVEGEKEIIIQEPQLKKNPRNNPLGKLGVFLFFIGLFGFDFIIATIVHNITGNAKIIFWISAVIYSLAALCGGLSLYVDNKDKKNGYEPNGGYGFAIMSIVMSIFTIILNIPE